MNFYHSKESINNSDTKKLNVYRIILICLIYIVLVITIFTISYEVTSYFASNQAQAQTPTDINGEITPKGDTPIVTTLNNEYLLKDVNGKISVFKVGEHQSFMQIDVHTSTLPYIDRQNLLEGIVIVGDDNLLSIIEDFDS